MISVSESSALKTFQRDFKNRTGYVRYWPTNFEMKTDDTLWEFRIAIYPDPHNLQKAADVLSPLFSKANLEFEIFSLNHSPNIKNHRVQRDAVNATLDTFSDHGRGKECCVHVRFNLETKEYEKNSEELKVLMLKAWALLQKNNVRIGYATPASYDNVIPVQEDLLSSPFFYASNRPGGHGILLTKIHKGETLAEELPDHDPLLFRNPFAGINFTLADLATHKIKIENILKFQNQRIQYQKKHLANAQMSMLEFMLGIESQEVTSLEQGIVERFNTIIDDFREIQGTPLAKLKFLQDHRDRLIWICDHWPRDVNNSVLCMSKEIELLKSKLEECINMSMADFEANLSAIEALLFNINTKKAFAEIENIKLEFKTHTVLNEDKLKLIEKDPANLQLHFRRLIDLKNQMTVLANENRRIEFLPLREAVESLTATLDTDENRNNKPLEILRDRLIKLQAQTLELALEDFDSAPDVNMLSDKVKSLVDTILSKDSDEKTKISAIETFEKEVREFKSFKKPTRTHVAAAIGGVIIAAVFAALGFAAYVLIGSMVASLLTGNPFTGVIGGVAVGALKGTLTGWALGVYVTSAVGLGGGIAVAVRFFGNDNLDQVVRAAHNVPALSTGGKVEDDAQEYQPSAQQPQFA